MKRENGFSIGIAILVISTCCVAQTKNPSHGDRHRKESHRDLPRSYRGGTALPGSNSTATADRELTKLEQQQITQLKAAPTRRPVKPFAATASKTNPGTAVKNPPINFTAQKPKNTSSQAANRRKAQGVKLR